MTQKYCLISHTHWDREWYLPFENFRMRLVDLMDHLLEILDNDPEYRFHLDAQTIVLEDYLAIRPHKRDILKKYIREGRILVGPWYVQNDFHLTSGEATVRNLLIGSDIAREFGGCMPIGYAADQFGLISQLPQILRQFNLKDCVFGRGFNRDVTEFWWESEDGSQVLCEHMKFWYNNAQRLSADPEGALSLVRQRGEACANHCATSNYLLMNGVDHLEAQEDLTEIIRKISPMLKENEAVFQDTLPEFMNRVRREVEDGRIKLQTHRGEFRDDGANNVLTGTLSSRVYLKQANVRAQAALEKQLEPLGVLLDTFGVKKYPRDYLRYLWKLLIENHPHDSICGCSVDPVHRHMMDRFARIEENTSELLDRWTDALISHLTPAGATEKDYRILLFNGGQMEDGHTRRVVADIPVDKDTGCFTITENGKDVPFIVESIEQNVGRRLLSPINLPGEVRVNSYTLRLDAGAVPGLSYRSLILHPCKGKLTTAGYLPCEVNVMENNFLRVVIHTDGTVDLTEKQSGRTYRNILAIEDSTDRGESYIYQPGRPEDTVVSSGKTAAIEIITENSLESSRRISFILPIKREEASGTVGVEMTLTLDRRSDELKVDIKLNNALTHHRTRLLIPTDLAADTNYAGQPFDCLVRNRISRFANDECHPNTDYVGMEDSEGGIAVLQEGLYEYEQMTDSRNTLAITLLRSTGRVTGSYANEPTMEKSWTSPEGFCLGEHTLHLAICPYSGSRITARIAARAQRFISPARAVCRPVDYTKLTGGRPFVQGPGMPDLFNRPLENAGSILPPAMTLFTIDSTTPDAMILSAVKAAEDGSGIILRLYNSTSAIIPFRIVSAARLHTAEKVNMAEEELQTLSIIDENEIALSAKPKEIITVKLTTM